MQFEKITEKIIAHFDEKTKKREDAIKMGRDLLRLSTLAVKKLHQKDLDESKKLLDEASGILNNINSIFKMYPDLRCSFDAMQEYVEARIFYSLICDGACCSVSFFISCESKTSLL